MNTAFQKLIRVYDQFRGLFPSALPTGLTEFNTWAESIAATYRLPTSNMDSVKFTLATMIMHLGPNAAYRSKYHFVLAIRASAAKQVAGAAFHEIKERDKAARAAAQAEATGQAGEAASSGQQK